VHPRLTRSARRRVAGLASLAVLGTLAALGPLPAAGADRSASTESTADGYFEAEEAALTGGAGVGTDHSGYSGAGFVHNVQSVGAGVTFTATVDGAGTYPVNLRYANGPNPFDGTKSMSLYVNDTLVGPWELPTTGNWQSWEFVTRNLDLQAGANTISLRYDDGDDGHVNLDVLSVGASPDLCSPAAPEVGYTALFDGTLETFEGWRLAGAGSFARQDDCTLKGKDGMGLLWYAAQEFESYSLKLDWKLVADHNSGIFVGFPNPGNDPWVAVNQGYEIQIDATDEPDRTTGAIYSFQGADPEAVAAALRPVPEWNSYEIRVVGQTIKVFLNGVLVNEFVNTAPARDLAQGFIGLQNHGPGETVYYRDIQIRPIGTAAAKVDAKVTPNWVRQGATTKVGVDVQVSGAAGSPMPTGTVRVTLGEAVRTVELVRGKATVRMPAAGLTAGVHDVTVGYLGDSTYGEGQATAVLTVW
jgi:hypothetical protein